MLKEVEKTDKAFVPQTHHEEPLHEQNFKEVEALAHELKKLLVRHENTLDEQGIRKEVETLERWMESYRHGLAAARKISEAGTSILSDLRNHLKLAIHESHRFEDEGGNPASSKESNRVDELMKTVRRIDGMLPNIEHVFHAMEPEPEDA